MDLVLVERVRTVAVVRLNRPHALNALSSTLISQLLTVIAKCDCDSEVGAMVLTGNDFAFCGMSERPIPLEC